MFEFESQPFQSTSSMLTSRMSADQLKQQQQYLRRLNQSGSTSLEFYRPAATVRAAESSTISEEFENTILEALGMREEEPTYAMARAPRPGGNTSIGELTPVGDAILPLLACVCVYIGMRIRRARKVAQMLNVEQ